MKAQQHCLFSQNKDMTIEFFSKFDKEKIKEKIISYLSIDPTDTIEHCRTYKHNSYKNQLGYEILNFYSINPKNGKPSLVITKGNCEYFKALT